MFVMLLLIGCEPSNPVEDCPLFPDRDCCTENVQCWEFYEDVAPYCVGANKEDGGVCSQCARNDHCPAGQVCDIVRDLGVCL